MMHRLTTKKIKWQKHLFFEYSEGRKIVQKDCGPENSKRAKKNALKYKQEYLLRKKHRFDANLKKIKAETICKTSLKPTANNDLLLDTMIVHKIINDKPITKKLKKIISTRNIRLIIPDGIIFETRHMEYDRFDRAITGEEIKDKVKCIGQLVIKKIDHASEYALKANEIFESKKYVDEYDKSLSQRDCMLLQLHLLGTMDLITEDNLLIDAAKQEGRAIVPYDLD